jgi:hypothetical protein
MFMFVHAGVVVFTACVPMTYTKSVTVHKDANGNIIGIDEVEAISEQHSEGAKIKPIDVTMQFQHLK